VATLAVFTVKRFQHIAGEYWTYGGFGEYVKSLLPHFDRVILACHPKETGSPPKGWYPLGAPNLQYFWLPYYEGEAQCLARLPEMFLKSRQAVLAADVVNARVPDYSGICGGFWACIYRKPLFINHVDNWHGRRGRSSRLRGIAKLGLDLHYSIYCAFEKMLCRDRLTFVQGHESWQIYGSSPSAVQCISTSHADGDVVRAIKAATLKKQLHIVSVGRLVHVKGHQYLIDALRILKDTEFEFDYRLSIAGEGERLADLKQQAERLNLLDRVAFIGQLDRSEIFELYDTADVFCLPSLREGTPKVLLEAMARGVPIVATDVGGVRSVVVNGETGVLVEPNNSAALAGALKMLAQSPALRSKLAKESLPVAREHTIEREWGRMIGIVQQTYPDLFSRR
jgi:glycosyltransferase involved in cell wall biosynthesis